MEILGIIPARGGSKRIPKKNIKQFHGKPLIAWTILSAIKSKLINKVIVTTDDKKIANISLKYGAEVPFLRPAKLAKSSTPIEPVIIHALEWLKRNKNYHPKGVALLMPTNPLKPPLKLDEAIKTFNNKKADSVISVCEALGNNNPYWILKKQKNKKITLFNNKSIKKIIPQSQLLPTCYLRNDVVYVFKPKNLYEKIPNLYGNRIELYIMEEIFNCDINSFEDWYIALDKFKRMKLKYILK